MSEPWERYEERVAAGVGGEVTEGSGQGQWVSMDAGSRGTLLISCKWTSHETRALRPAEFDEVRRAVRGPGGVGGDVLPALAIGIGDRSFIVMEEGDWEDLVVRREPIVVQMDRSESRRSDSRDTPLMRAARREI